MTITIDRFRTMLDGLSAVQGIVVQESKLQPGFTAAELDDLEHGLKVRFCDELRTFYQEIGEVSVSWSLAPSIAADAFSEDEIGYLSGSIGILEPFTMVKGKLGRHWKDEIWFDFLPAEEQALFAAFVPFDFPLGEYAFGFNVTEGQIGPTMRCFTANDGIIASPFALLEDYLEHLIRTRGLVYADRPSSLPTPDFVERVIAVISR